MQRSRPTLFRLILATALILAASRADAAEGFALTPLPGPHPVALKVIAQSDASRASLPEPDVFGHSKYGERARPMQTLLWYPAAASGRHIAYLDYLKTSWTEDDTDIPAADVARALDAKSARIKALVSLDGSVCSYPQLIADSKYVTPLTVAVAVPMLSIGSASQSIEYARQAKLSSQCPHQPPPLQ